MKDRYDFFLTGLGCVAAGFAYGAALCGATERWPDRMLALARWAGEVALPVLAVVAAVLVLACLAVSALCGGDDDEDGGER